MSKTPRTDEAAKLCFIEGKFDYKPIYDEACKLEIENAALRTFINEYVSAWEDGMAHDNDLYQRARFLIKKEKR